MEQIPKKPRTKRKSTSTTPMNSFSDHQNQNQTQKTHQQEQQEKPQSSTTISTTTTASDLPYSIIIEILSRLPLRTLIQCTHLCKSWRNLLSEPYFQRLFSHHSPSTLMLRIKGTSLTSLTTIHLLEESSSLVNTGSTFSRQILVSNHRCKDKDDDQKGSSSRFDRLIFNLSLSFRFQLGNGCHGLICLREITTREPKLVWNPILAQYVVLPIPEPGPDHENKVVSGFGYCGRTYKYKVLRVFNSLQAQIYELGVGNKWRDIGLAPFEIPSKIPGFYVNECLHWIIEDGVELICCFNFCEEKFGFVAGPPLFDHRRAKSHHWSNLGILGGNCLSISAIDAKIFRPDVQVWVMEEYGVAGSWVMRLSIRDPAIDWWDPYKWIQVIQVLKNGEVLMLCAHQYVLAYNVKERRFRSVETMDFPAIAHVPGFISLEDVLKEDLGTGSLSVRYL